MDLIFGITVSHYVIRWDEAEYFSTVTSCYKKMYKTYTE